MTHFRLRRKMPLRCRTAQDPVLADLLFVVAASNVLTRSMPAMERLAGLELDVDFVVGSQTASSGKSPTNQQYNRL